MADDQATEVSQNSQLAQEVSTLVREAKGTIRASSWFSTKDLKLYLDALQRLVCLGLAVWVMLHNNNIWEFIAILAISQVDRPGAKDILVRVLKGFISEGK